MAKELQRVAQQPLMTEASSGAMVLGFAMVSIEVPATARGALCKLAQLGCKDSFAALKLGPFEPLLEHDQVSNELAALQHLHPTPSCLPQAMSGLLHVAEAASQHLQSSPRCRGLLTKWLGTCLGYLARPLQPAQLLGLARCLLQAISFMEEHGCSHNDLQPRNLVQCFTDSSAKPQYAVIDLGSATFVSTEELEAGCSAASRR